MIACSAICLNIMITATDYRARSQGNVCKYPKTVRKKNMFILEQVTIYNILWKLVI